MAAVPITTLEFANGAWEQVRGQFAEAVSQYDVVYFDNNDSKWRKADSSAGTDLQAGSRGVGIAANPIINVDSWGNIITSGTLIINSSGFIAGNDYGVGGVSAGSIESVADIDTGGYRKTYLFTAKDVSGTTQEIIMNPNPSNTVSS